LSPQDRSDARQALVAKFRVVAAERLQRLNNALLELERTPGAPTAADTLMREIHTLKGEAKLVGFADINMVAHRTEDLLVAASRQGFVLAAGAVDLILRGFDLISVLLQKQAGETPPGADLGAYASAVDAHLQTGAALSAPVGRTAALSSELQRASRLQVDAQKIDALAVHLGDILRLHRQAREGVEALAGLLGDLGQAVVSRRPGALRGLANETRALMGAHRAAVLDAADRLQELEGMVHDLRMVPLHVLLERYPRAVRDLAAEQGKRVQVVMRGGEVEADKQVLDAMAEPFLHLIRNAVDHGLEAPRERAAAGKPEQGTVTLEARQVGTHVEVSVCDDGRGLSVELVRRAAVSKGLMGPSRAAKLTAEESLELVFQPGFSTRAEATDISGRGIGLGTVKQRVESLGGSVRIESRPGQGTTVTADLPISVALVRVLVVEQGGACFGFAAAAVELVEALAAERLVSAGRGTALRLADGQVPLWDLSELLDLPSVEERTLDQERALVLGVAGRRVAIRVQRIVGERAIVQRELDPFMRALPIFIGAGVLEHGRPLLVINVPALANAIGDGRPRRPAASGETSGAQATILVAEDSELTRDMLAGMGYRVVEATDGEMALRQLEQQPVDLVMTDLEMPIVDGFALIGRIRQSRQLGDLPIIVLSSRGSAADKERAAVLGADAFLVKSEFRNDAVAQLVERYLRRGQPQKPRDDRADR